MHAYSLASLAFLSAYLGLSWVCGMSLLAALGLLGEEGMRPGRHLLAIPSGTAVLITLLFVLAASGFLRPLPVSAACFLLLVFCAWYLQQKVPRWWQPLNYALALVRGVFREQPYAAMLLSLAVLLTFFRAMAPALEWDDMAHHLPFARDLAQAGGLVVDETLRYPLNPGNLHLLWAAALMFAAEPATHLVNAVLAGMVTFGVYAYCRERGSRAAGILAALIYLSVARELMNTAYVELALSAFTFFAFHSLILWRRERRDGFLLLSALLLAMAAGTKYHGLLQLPAFALALLVVSRAPLPWLKAGSILLLFGSWWYLRSWVISGDPLHPLGGPVFGFWLWDEQDLASQYRDIARYGHHLPAVLWPAVLFALLPGTKKPERVMLLIIGIGGALAWYFSSRYGRYLLPAIPFLAIMSAQVLVQAAAYPAFHRVAAGFRSRNRKSGLRAAKVLGFSLVAAGLIFSTWKEWEKSCFTEACVDRVYANELHGWPAVQSAPRFPALRLYQYGFENERYVLGDDVAGDWFGPYRYRQIRSRSHDPAALRQVLQRLGRDSILVNRKRHPFDQSPAGDELSAFFEILYEDEHAGLYRIR